MNFTEDTVAMFADFGVTATLDGASVRGIFDNGAAAGLGGMMLGGNPVFICPATAAPLSSRGKTLAVGSTSYTVREVKPDGTGMTMLELEAQ